MSLTGMVISGDHRGEVLTCNWVRMAVPIERSSEIPPTPDTDLIPDPPIEWLEFDTFSMKGRAWRVWRSAGLLGGWVDDAILTLIDAVPEEVAKCEGRR